MAENKIEELCKILGVELYRPFYIKNRAFNPFMFTKEGLFDCNSLHAQSVLYHLITGEYEIIGQKTKRKVLMNDEKEYLEFYLKNTKDRVINIRKVNDISNGTQYISVLLDEDNKDSKILHIPLFDMSKKYKGIKAGRLYSLKELGLFKED